jgi:outer membrane protein assembly factor BamB
MSADYQIYVTFSGESGWRVQFVAALSSVDGSLIGPVTEPYEELRGMALDDAGRFYLAVAYKKASAVNVFGPPAKDASRPFLQTLLWPPTSKTTPSPVGLVPAIGLWHPYGLTIAPPAGGNAGTIYVSSQDTNVVCGYTIEDGATMTATPVPPASALATYGSTYVPGSPSATAFYPGTVAASQKGVPVTLQPPPTPETVVTPPVVPAPLGLSLNFDPADLVKKKAASAAPADPSASQSPSKHSVRGVQFAGGVLYVADENGNRVVCYDPSSGTVLGEITTTSDKKSNPNALSTPVGLAYDPAKNYLYIGAPGKTGAIFAYHVASGHLHLVVSAATDPSHADALSKVSGLAVAPDGTLLFASRKTQKIYSVDSSGKIQHLTPSALPDVPEDILVVDVPA